MVKQLVGAVAVVALTAAGVLHEPATGIVCGLLLAALLVVLHATPTDVEVREAHASPSSVVVARIAGPLTFLSRGRLMGVLEGAIWPRHLLLDMSAVPFVDGGGLGELEDVVDFLSARGSTVMVAGCRPGVRDALQRTGVVGRLVGQRVFTNVDSALLTWTRPPVTTPPRSASRGDSAH